MAKTARGAERREDALSVARIVEAAIEVLDEEGEDGLTFRTLAARLETGPGAIYWHIASKSELLVAASDAIIERALRDIAVVSSPREAVRGIATVVFEAIDAHPWVGAQLSRAPWQTAVLQIFEGIGREVQALGVPPRAQFTAASALVSYILGVSRQNAAQGRLFDPSVDRDDFLAAEAARWMELDPTRYRFTRSVAARLRKHDDLVEFLAGVDLFLAGIARRHA